MDTDHESGARERYREASKASSPVDTRPGSSESIQTSGCTMLSYLQFLNGYARVRPDYKWLQTFLSTPGPPESVTKATIIDCIDESFEERGQFVSNTDEFALILESRPVEVEMRLVVVEYRESWSVDRTIVDKLGLFFDIDADFFRRHFYYHFICTEDDSSLGGDRFAEDNIHDVTHAFFSGRQVNEFHLAATRSYDKLSAYIHQESNTMLVWIRFTSADFVSSLSKTQCESPPKPSLGFSTLRTSEDERRPLYIDQLRHMSKDDILIGKKEPAYFLYPYVQDLVVHFPEQYVEKNNINLESVIVQRADFLKDSSSADSKLFQMLFELGSLSMFEREVERIHDSLLTDKARMKFDRVQNDVSYIKKNFERSAEYFRELKSAALITAQMEETQASTDASLSVNRLSRLAFFFIPLSFTATVFGMNLVEFGQGTIRLQTFLITAAVIAACTILPISVSMWAAVRRSGFLDNLRIVPALLWYCPKMTLWYVGLCVQYEHAIVMALCGREILRILKWKSLAKYPVLELKEAKSRMKRAYYSFEDVYVWEDRADAICARLRELREHTDSEK